MTNNFSLGSDVVVFAQVDERSVTGTNDSPFQGYSHLDDQTIQRASYFGTIPEYEYSEYTVFMFFFGSYSVFGMNRISFRSFCSR